MKLFVTFLDFHMKNHSQTSSENVPLDWGNNRLTHQKVYPHLTSAKAKQGQMSGAVRQNVVSALGGLVT